LFTAGEDGCVKAWRAEDGTYKCALIGHDDWVTGVTVCAYGKTLCSASHDGSVIVWSVGKLVRLEKTQRDVVQGFLATIGK
jgi:WD40 repeat protein|tara:strand:- start:156 stop:398 length:243 start_codon:yes stop_codon:yes gene_type:complete